jgi:hypothetical protein
MEPFWQCLAETIAWCSTRANEFNPGESLRSRELKGRSLERGYRESVQTVAGRRRLALLPINPEPTRDLAKGRLLVYFPGADLCDGAAEAESNGFFDVYNTPPWDTWVAFVEESGNKDLSYSSYLISWVAPVFLDLASAGILVNPEECIRWLDHSGVEFARILQ